jgi:apolipoprotein N-acyltransferase
VRVGNALSRTGRWIWSVRRLVLLAGALPVLSFPDANLEFLAWFGLVPGLVLIVRSPSAREGGMRAWWLAAVGGVWLISIALVMANVVIVLVIGSLPRLGTVLHSGPAPAAGAARAPGPATLRPGLAVLGVIAGVASVSAGPLAFALTPASPAVRQVTIAMVQPGIINNTVQRVDASERLTAELSRSGRLGGVEPDLIVWGESSTVDLTLAENRGQLLAMQKLSSQDGADLLVNQDMTVPGKGQEKVGVLVSPAGLEGEYIKTRLVPFGEYIPFRQQLGWLTKISRAAAANMIPGTGAHVLYATDRTGKPLPIGVLICFESAFPDMSRVDTDQGAQLIVYQSETSTFQGTWGPDQHAALGAVRAAETGRPVVQAALTGDTVAYDARGRLLAWMGQSARGVVTVRLGLPAASAKTIYDRFGDYVPWSAVGVTLLAALVMFANSRGFPGRNAGIRGKDEAQYVAGQSVPS